MTQLEPPQAPAAPSKRLTFWRDIAVAVIVTVGGCLTILAIELEWLEGCTCR